MITFHFEIHRLHRLQLVAHYHRAGGILMQDLVAGDLVTLGPRTRWSPSDVAPCAGFPCDDGVSLCDVESGTPIPSTQTEFTYDAGADSTCNLCRGAQRP
ncbi:hypothetical protein CBL_02727 [Carabus blaptoides fortunei]